MAFTPIDEEEIINEPVAEEAKPRFIPIEDDEFFGIAGEEEAPEPTSPLGTPAPVEAPKSRFTPISDEEFFGIETPKEEPQQPSDWDTLRGAEVALRQVPQLAYGVAGLVGATSEQITGYGEALRDFGFRGYKEWEESMEPISKETDDITVAWERAKEGDVGALVDWAQYGVGYALGQLGETAAVAVLGGLAGAATGAPAGGVGAVPAAAGGAIAAAATKQGFKALARDLVEKAIANQATKIVTRQAAKEGIELTAEQLAKRASQDVIKRQAGKEIGSNVAVFGNAIGMQLGSIYGEAESKAQSEGRDLTGYDLARVWGTGIATGGLEGVVDKLGLDLLKGKLSGALPEGRLAGAAVAGGVGTLGEAATEGIQTVGERFGAGKDILGDDALNEYINAAALGGLGGGVIGGAGGFVSGNPKENAAAKAKVSAEASKSIAPESSKLVSDQADAVINEVAQEPPEQRVARLQREAQEGVGIDLEEEVPVSGLPPVEPTPPVTPPVEGAVAPVEPVVPVAGAVEPTVTATLTEPVTPTEPAAAEPVPAATPRPAVDVESLSPNAKRANRILNNTGVDPETAAFVAQQYQDEIADLGGEELRAFVLDKFEENGGVIPARMRYSEDQEYYELAFGIGPEEAATLVENAKAQNAQMAQAELEQNKQWRRKDEQQQTQQTQQGVTVAQPEVQAVPLPAGEVPPSPAIEGRRVPPVAPEAAVTPTPTEPTAEPPTKEQGLPKYERFDEKYVKGIRPSISNRLDYDSRYSDIITEAAGRKLSKEQEIEVVVEWMQRGREQGELALWSDFGGLSMDQAYRVKPSLVSLGLIEAAKAPISPMEAIRKIARGEKTEEGIAGIVASGFAELYNGQPVLTQAGLETLPEAERPRLTPEARKIQIDTRTSEAAAEAISKNLRIGVDQVPVDVRMPEGWTIEGDIYIPPTPEVAPAPEVAPEAAPTSTKITQLENNYNEAKAKLDALGQEPIKPSPESRFFGAGGRSQANPSVVAKYDADVKAYNSYRRKYSAAKKAEVEASNKLFRARQEAAPAPQPEARESRRAATPQQDRDYLDAVERGDYKTAQRILDSGFPPLPEMSQGLKEEMGYWLNASNESGNVMPSWLALKDLMGSWGDRDSVASSFKKELQDIGIKLGYYQTISLEDAKLRASQGLNLGKGYDFKRGDKYYIGDGKTPLDIQPTETRDDAGNIITPSQRFQQGEADIRYARTERDPEVQKAAQDLKAGTIDRDEYQRIVDMRMPLRKFEAVPIPANNNDMLRGLGDRKAGERLKKDLIQDPESIAEGTVLEARLDIPAYESENVWVVSLHKQRTDLQKGTAAEVVAYTPTSVLRNVTFGVTEKAAVGIAAGKPKSTIATMRGEYVPMTAEQAYELANTNKEQWVEIGMNPVRHSYFYDKDTQTPVVSAEEVVQVGGMVLAKNPVFGKKEDYLYSLAEAAPTVGMTTDAVRARLEALGFGVEGMIRIVEDPQAAFEGRTIIQDGKAVRIELNASALNDDAAIDRVLNHEFAEAANADGALNKLVERLTPKEKKEINDAITRLGYEERVRTTEEAARAIEALAAGWRGRGFFERAVARVEAWGSKLGLKLTRRAAEYIAARNLSDINAGFKAAYNRFINVRGEAREGRAFVTPEENARFMELAKDPEANREELQRMVDAAAQAAGYAIDAYHGGTGLVGDAFDKAMRGANTGSPSSLKGFFFASNKRLSDWYATTSTGETQFKELTEAYDKKSKNMRNLKSQMIEILRGKVEQNPNPDIAKLIIDGAAKWDDADSRAVVDSVFGAIPAIQELRARYDELANTDTFKLQEIMEASFREPERLMDLLENRGTTDKFKLSFKNPLIVDHRGKRGGASYTELIEQAEAAGNDGVIIRNTEDPLPSDIFIALEPEQIKSADAITRDNQGNVIPLDQRFQPATADIRYSRAEIRESRREPAPTFTEESPEAKTLSNLKASMEKVDAASEAKGGKPKTQKVSEIAANWMESGGDERALQDAIIENTNLSPVNAAKVAKVIAKQYDIQQSIATAFLETQTGLSVEALPEGVTLPKEVDPDRPKPVMSRLFEVFMGVRVPPVKIQVNEKAALKDQIRLKAAANRAAKAEQKRTAEEVVEVIKAMELLGPVRPKQVQALAKRAARVIWTSEKSVEAFSEYAAKVVENANYDADLREAKDAQKRAKQLSTQKKVAMSPQREVLEDVSKVPVNKLDDPRMFAEAVNYYLRGFKAVLSPDYVVIPDAEMESYLSGAQSETLRNQRDLDREANERLARKYGIEPDQVNEMMESIDIIKQIEAQENREALENLLTEKAVETQQGLRGYDTDNLRADQRSIVSSMLKVDPKALDPEERQRFIRITNNIIYNNQTNGAEYFVAVAKGQQSAREAAQDSTMVAKNRAWINLLPRFVSERMQRGWALELQSIADTFRNAFGKGAMAQVYDLMGMLDLNLGFTKANNTIDEIQKKIGDFHRGLEKKYKAAARNQDGLLAEGIVGFLIQSIPKKDEVTSINQRRDLILQDIANRRRSTAQPDRIAMADRIEAILNLIDGESVEAVLNNMKREFRPNYESLIWYKDTLLPQYKDFLKNFDENFNDQANNYENPNYLTIGFTSAGPSLAITPEEQGMFYDQVSLNPKQSAYTIKRVDYSKLPKGKEIEFNLRRNVFNGLSDQINKAYTSSAWQRIASFMKTPEAEVVFGGAANKDFFIERLNRLRLSRMRRGSMGSGGAIEKAVDSLSVISRKLGTGIALGGIYQWIKQPPDQLVTAWGSGGRGDLLARNIAPSTQKAARELLNKFSIGRRGDASAGYKYINQMEGHQNRLERYFSESKWDQAKEQAGKIADVWMVALKSSDFLAASAAWMTYYEGELNKKDIKIDDWSKEAALIESDPARRQAAAFAEQMTDIYQGSSDPTSMATFAQSGKTGWENLVKAIFVPFNSFAIQQRMRLYSDAVDAINGNKSGVGGLAGTIGGLILFHTTKRYVIPAISGVGIGVLYGLMGVDMDEPDEEKQKEEANKNWRQFLADLTGNLLVGGTPQIVESQFIDAMNRASYLVSLQLENDSILNDEGEIMSYDQYSKERSPFYRYKSYDNAMSLGMLDIGMGQAEQVALQTKMLASPEEMEMYTPEEQRMLYFSALSEWLLLMRLNDTDFARLVSKARRDMINAAKEREKYIKSIRSGR